MQSTKAIQWKIDQKTTSPEDIDLFQIESIPNGSGECF
jgi:hypothetical protein